ncbi:MAG: bifunctional 4-hydroxy-2-oxoglutarate aldolase/2-dehydro-3-deoxy-phosphogluconate aldolase [Clostridia bacterium]|nr:bifunctional 4-hydroxy-2-oxoglutarate aldolase/2-dehydro-3-deoxy-phosphogluconate aldolase [Clostridia bacterium]
MNSEKVITAIEKEKIIVIVRGIYGQELLNFAEAAYRGGIRLLECTFDATGAVTDEQTAENIKTLIAHFGDKMLIGAGTVLNEKQVELTAAVGGKFIISPDVNVSVIKKTKELGLVSIPGAFTPTEATAAHNAGADFVKLFPIAAMGARYIKDLKAPLSHIRFLAVGGVTADNITEFLKAGALGFGIASDIANKELIKSGNFAAIEERARCYTEQIKAF